MSDSGKQNNNYDSIDRMMRLHTLIDESKELEQKLEQQTTVETLNTISRIVNDADEIISEGTVKERATNTTEAVLDSMLLKINHELVSKLFQHTATFNDKMYTNAILDIVLKSRSKDWDVLAHEVCGVGRFVHTNATVVGSLDINLKGRVSKQRLPRTMKNMAVERPEVSNKLDRHEEGSDAVKKILKQIEQIYNTSGHVPIPYYKLIIDPDNFMDTIHNAFQICFLVRENIIALEDGPDGYPQVRLVRVADRSIDNEPSQKVCRLDLQICNKMSKFYNIKEALLKKK